MKREISEKNKTLVLKAEKVFSEVWKFMQREANKETPLEDALFALKQLIKHGKVANPWGFLETVIQTKQQKEEIVDREEAWDKKKIKEREDIEKWLKSFTNK